MMDRLYSQGDNLNHNFCRTADPKDTRPWCYTTNPNRRFDYCDCYGPMPTTAATTVTIATTVTALSALRPICGTITRESTFEYSRYGNNASIVSRPRSNGNRVFGGEDATPGEVPWQVNLLLDGHLRCGGTLVSTTVRLICYISYVIRYLD